MRKRTWRKLSGNFFCHLQTIWLKYETIKCIYKPLYLKLSLSNTFISGRDSERILEIFKTSKTTNISCNQEILGKNIFHSRNFFCFCSNDFSVNYFFASEEAPTHHSNVWRSFKRKLHSVLLDMKYLFQIS